MEEEAENAQNFPIFCAQPGFPRRNIFPNFLLRGIAVYPLGGIAVPAHIVPRLGINFHHPRQIRKLRFSDFHSFSSLQPNHIHLFDKLEFGGITTALSHWQS